MVYYHFRGGKRGSFAVFVQWMSNGGNGREIVLPAVRAVMLQENCSVARILAIHFPLTWKTKVELIQIHQC